MNFHVILASPNDLKKLEEGFQRAVDELDDVKVTVSYGSVHRTPSKIPFLAYPDARVEASGAGLSNGLTGIIVAQYSDGNKVNIGIPISDSNTGGVASFFSTSELPPGYDCLTTGIDNAYAATRMAAEACKRRERVILLDADAGEGEIERLAESLDKFGVPYKRLTVPEAGEVNVVLNDHTDHLIRDYDEFLAEHDGVQLVVNRNSPIADIPGYAHLLDNFSVSGTVGVGRYENAAILAGHLIGLKVHTCAYRTAKAKDVYSAVPTVFERKMAKELMAE